MKAIQFLLAFIFVIKDTVISCFGKQSVSGIVLAYSATELLEARAFLADAQAGKIQQNELRRPLTGALMAIEASGPSLILGGTPTLKNLREASEQPVKIPILTKLTADNGTARECGTGGQEGDSAMVTLTWQTLSEKFSMSELLYANNMVQYQQAFRHNFMEKFRILHQRLEVLVVAYYEANKSLVNAGTINTFSVPTSTMPVTLANKNQYFASIYAEMMQNNFMPEYFNVHGMSQFMLQLLQQLEGSGNQNNLAPQQNGFKHYGTNLFTAPSGASSGSYIFIPGTVGLVGPWMNKLHRDGQNLGDIDVWTTIPDPFIPGWTWELKIKRGCVDNSGVSAGREADLVTRFVISGDFSFVKAYTSNTDTGIYKYALMTA